MITVEDLLTDALPPGSTVLAGASGLGLEVTWAAALRSRPPAFEGLKGGELAIVSLSTLRQLDDRLTLARLMDQLGSLGVVAIAVIGAADEAAIEAAERHGVPLLQLPADASARDLEVRVTRVIVDRRAELQRRGQDLYHQMLELIVSGRGSEAVVSRLAELTGRPAVLQDSALNLLALRVPLTSTYEQREVAAMLAARKADDSGRLQTLPANAADPPTIRLPLDGNGTGRIVAPVGGAQGREGYLSVVGPVDQLSALDRLAVSRAAAACAIDLGRERASRPNSDARLAEVLDELLAGGYPSEAALVGRAQRLGCDLTQSNLALALRPSDTDGLSSTRSLERLVRREFARRSLPPAVRADRTDVIALVPATVGREAVRTMINVLRDGIAGLGGRLAVAIGRPAAGPADLRIALLTAQRALDTAVRRNGPDALVSLLDLGVDELLISMGEHPVLGAFRDAWLQKLTTYDQRNGTQLLATLAAYFEAHSSPTEAAAQLHLHRNTLLYRLQRIREITGCDPDDPACRLAFHLALRIQDVLGEA